MPDLTGIPIITAQAHAEQDRPEGGHAGLRGCVCAHREHRTRCSLQSPIAPGTVIAQQPMAGARVDQTTMIKLTVAK